MSGTFFPFEMIVTALYLALLRKKPSQIVVLYGSVREESTLGVLCGYTGVVFNHHVLSLLEIWKRL